MTTSSEDVLLLIGEVKHRKYDGALYMMSERIAWMPNTKESFTISHRYADIKSQKISPEGKAKIQLQVVLHSGEATTFHFVSSEGIEKQLRDRNEVKELLQQLLPRFKKKISKEIEEKQRILSADPDLYQLYQDLVASQVITAEEFWTQLAPIRCPSLIKTLNIPHPPPLHRAAGLAGSTGSSLPAELQPVGISPAFLSDIRPQTDGCNGIRYNITKDIVEAIFRTYPAVKRKHFENVPAKMSEEEFWTRFFQSHYFHRDRVFAGSTSSKMDLFADCARSDELDIERAANRGVHDPFVDVTGFHDSHHVNYVEDHRPSSSKALIPNKSVKDRDKGAEGGSIGMTPLDPNQALIKRFNHHSIMVMEASLGKDKSEKTHPHVHLNGTFKNSGHLVNGHNHVDEEVDISEEVRRVKKKRLAEMTQLDDLEGEQNGDPLAWMSKGTKPLKITQKERYLHGPIPSGYEFEGSGSEELLDSVKYQESILSEWHLSPSICLSSPAALTALSELSPGGALLKSSYSVLLKDVVPGDLQKQLKQIYFSCNELLRHFWACFPVSGEKLEEKLVQTKNTLERFQVNKIQPFHEKLVNEHQDTELTTHLMGQLQIAYNKFTAWQAKKNALSRK